MIMEINIQNLMHNSCDSSFQNLTRHFVQRINRIGTIKTKRHPCKCQMKSKGLIMVNGTHLHNYDFKCDLTLNSISIWAITYM